MDYEEIKEQRRGRIQLEYLIKKHKLDKTQQKSENNLTESNKETAPARQIIKKRCREINSAVVKGSGITSHRNTQSFNDIKVKSCDYQQKCIGMNIKKDHLSQYKYKNEFGYQNRINPGLAYKIIRSEGDRNIYFL